MSNKNRMLTVVIALMLISFMSLSFAVSYSYISQSKISANYAQAVTTNMDFTISITNRTGTTFGFVEDTSKYAYFTFNKPAGYDTHYYIAVCHSFTTANTTTRANYIPYEDLWIQFFNADNNGAPTTAISEPTRIADNSVFTPSTATFANAIYDVYVGFLNSSNSSKKVSALVWRDPERAYLYNNKIVNISLVVYQYPLRHTTYHTISGYVYDRNNNPVSGAKVIFQNGSITSVTDSNGAYSLPDVGIGTWKLDVLDSTSNKLYSTTIRVYSGTPGVTKYGPYSYTSSTGYHLQRIAYARYTTPYKILKRNNMTTNSNYIPDVNYTTEPYYGVRIVDTFDNLPISNVNIKYAEGDTLELSYVASS